MRDIKGRLRKVEKIEGELDKKERAITFIIPQYYRVPFDKLESCPAYLKRKKGKPVYLPCHECSLLCNLPSEEIPKGVSKLSLNMWFISHRGAIIVPVKKDEWPVKSES